VTGAKLQRLEPEDGREAERERLRLRYVLVVWGEKYIERYFDSAFPTHLSAKNLPELAYRHDLSFAILTREADSKAFERNPRFAQMKRLGPVEFIAIDDLLSHAGVFTVTLTLAFTRAIRAAGDEATGINFIFMNADFILADGTLATVARRLEAGAKAVMTASPRAIAEEVGPIVAKLPADDDGSITLKPRQAVKMVLSAPHPMVFAKQPDRQVIHTTVPNQYFWFVDPNTLLARSFLMFMLAVRPKRAHYRATSYCDYSLISDLVDEDDISVIDDSDDGFILELQSGNQEIDTVRLGALKESDAIQHLGEWTTAHHRSIAQYDLVFHSGPLPDQLPQARKAARAFINRLLAALPSPIDPHAHPYWIGGVHAWQFHRPGVPLPDEVDTSRLMQIGGMAAPVDQAHLPQPSADGAEVPASAGRNQRRVSLRRRIGGRVYRGLYETVRPLRAALLAEPFQGDLTPVLDHISEGGRAEQTVWLAGLASLDAWRLLGLRGCREMPPTWHEPEDDLMLPVESRLLVYLTDNRMEQVSAGFKLAHSVASSGGRAAIIVERQDRSAVEFNQDLLQALMACDPATVRYAKSQLRDDEGFDKARDQFAGSLAQLRQAPSPLRLARAGIEFSRLAYAQARLRWTRRRLSPKSKKTVPGVVFLIENQGTEQTTMRRIGQAVGQSFGELVKGREGAMDEPRVDGESGDIVALMPDSRKKEAAGLIAEVMRSEPDAAGRLAHFVLMFAQDMSDDQQILLATLDVAEHQPLLQSGSLFLNLGHLLIAKDLAQPAMRAYLKSNALVPNNKWHAGQRLLDYVVQQRPDAAVLTVICESLDAATDFVVPDLNAAIVRRGVELEDFDLARLDGLARSIGWQRLSEIGHALVTKGQHQAALRAYDVATMISPDEIQLRMQMGSTQFLAGNYIAAEREWALTAYMRGNTRSRWGLGESGVRFLGESWFAAIGHVAYIDTYVKSVELGWRPRLRTVCTMNNANPPPGASLLRRWSEYIDVISVTQDPSPVERKLIGYPTAEGEDEALHKQRRSSLTEEFYFGPDGEGRTRWYAPLGAEVERAWKAAGRGPLLHISDDERSKSRRMLAQVFGLPEDAWFVGLHVREPGFHAAWHKHHPGTRHADIAAYDRVIDFVTRAGGWVVRLGDRSMTPISPRPQVIDYATSSFRNFDLDVFLCATCTYFIGTNSGLSLLPPLFGRRCVLTNWSPVAIPNWYLDDIYIPKLVRNVAQDRHLTFKEMFGSKAGWTQWRRDYADGVEAIEDNDPADLLDAVRELHDEVVNGLPLPADAQALADRFNELAVAGGSYVGSRIGTRFATKYKHLLDG
jgi:putative glycosyltransferase (TIGR04372 family)